MFLMEFSDVILFICDSSSKMRFAFVFGGLWKAQTKICLDLGQVMEHHTDSRVDVGTLTA
jgi:hypothetical protein